MISLSDKRMMDELPESVKGQIYIDFLFADFLKSYKKYFNSMQEKFNHSIFKNQSKNHFSAQNQNEKMRNFLVEFVKHLEPRIY